MNSPVVQWQLIAPDPERVAAFYAKLFGWRVSSNNALGYRQVDTGEGGTPGGIWPASPGNAAFVQLFVSVLDVAAAARQAESLGATVIVPPSTLPDGDTMAVLRDPAGIAFGLMQAR